MIGTSRALVAGVLLTATASARTRTRTIDDLYQMLAERGIAVWVCDNRSASGKGAQSAWTSYKNCGEQELKDVEDGLTWLKKQSSTLRRRCC